MRAILGLNAVRGPCLGSKVLWVQGLEFSCRALLSSLVWLGGPVSQFHGAQGGV